MGKKGDNHMEFEGVMLTPRAINRLTILQDNHNENLIMVKECLANAVCYLATRLDEAKDDDIQKVKHLLTDLSFIREYIDDLKYPDNLTGL